MQRWIMIGGMVLMLGCVGLTGGFLWLKNERANRPDRIWVPIPLNTGLSHEQHVEFAEHLHARLSTDEVLEPISIEMNLRELGQYPSEEAAVGDLRARLMCEVGEHNYAPSLNIGFRGKRKEKQLLRDLTERLMVDFQKIARAPDPAETP